MVKPDAASFSQHVENVGVRQVFTLAGEAVNMEVCALNADHLPVADLAAALTHDRRVSSTGERGAAVVVASVKTRLELNCKRRHQKHVNSY